MRSADDNIKLAVLIDADNVSSSVIKDLLEEIAKFGTANVKRAYGDWTTQNLAGWKDHINQHAIQPIQQFGYTKGKNSTDSSLIIGAMDLLYSGNIDGFCLVSSDSDFTGLAMRLRESGRVVYGFGERKTPEAFRAACNQFVFFEVLKATVEKSSPSPKVEGLPELRDIFDAALTDTSREDGWSSLGELGSNIQKRYSSFDSRLFGFGKLSQLVRAQKYLEVEETRDEKGHAHVNVRRRVER